MKKENRREKRIEGTKMEKSEDMKKGMRERERREAGHGERRNEQT